MVVDASELDRPIDALDTDTPPGGLLRVIVPPMAAERPEESAAPAAAAEPPDDGWPLEPLDQEAVHRG